MIYEKECPICGVFFQTKTKIRKYCDKCIDQSGHKAEKVEREIARSKREHRAVDTITYNCELCGREHTIETRLVHKVKISGSSRSSWDGEDHYYCCKEHADQDRHDHCSCSFCGNLLKGSDYSYSMFRPLNFCSKACEENYYNKVAIENGWNRTCQYCGKEFINRKPAYFCCKECANAAKKSGWISPAAAARKEKRAAKQVTVKYKCDNCKNLFLETYKSDVEAAVDRNSHHFCSKECRNHYIETLQHKVREAKLKKKAEAAKPNPGESLCATCKVSYKDCERMQSDFRIIPKGAHYDSNGILVECPKYKR